MVLLTPSPARGVCAETATGNALRDSSAEGTLGARADPTPHTARGWTSCPRSSAALMAVGPGTLPRGESTWRPLRGEEEALRPAGAGQAACPPERRVRTTRPPAPRSGVQSGPPPLSFWGPRGLGLGWVAGTWLWLHAPLECLRPELSDWEPRRSWGPSGRTSGSASLAR